MDLRKNSFYGLSGLDYSQTKLIENVKKELEERNIKPLESVVFSLSDNFITQYGYKVEQGGFIPIFSCDAQSRISIFNGGFNFVKPQTFKASIDGPWMMNEVFINKLTTMIVTQALEISMCLKYNMVILNTKDIDIVDSDVYILKPFASTDVREWIITKELNHDVFTIALEKLFSIYARKENTIYTIRYQKGKTLKWEKTDYDIFSEYEREWR